MRCYAVAARAPRAPPPPPPSPPAPSDSCRTCVTLDLSMEPAAGKTMPYTGRAMCTALAETVTAVVKALDRERAPLPPPPPSLAAAPPPFSNYSLWGFDSPGFEEDLSDGLTPSPVLPIPFECVNITSKTMTVCGVVAGSSWAGTWGAPPPPPPPPPSPPPPAKASSSGYSYSYGYTHAGSGPGTSPGSIPGSVPGSSPAGSIPGSSPAGSGRGSSTGGSTTGSSPGSSSRRSLSVSAGGAGGGGSGGGADGGVYALWEALAAQDNNTAADWLRQLRNEINLWQPCQGFDLDYDYQ